MLYNPAVAEEYDFKKLAQEIVSARLKDIAAAPDAAAEIACQIIVSGVQSTRQRQDPRLTVMNTCRGVMSGMMLIDQDLGAAAVAILKSMANLAQELHLDPAQTMTWAMEGIASVVILGAGDLQLRVTEAIDENIMGAGAVFVELCAQAKAERGS
ncbi:MAG: hypothetical protein WC881_06925 [Elusimicrobiota bacterium]|jgi:hypothetical protein